MTSDLTAADDLALAPRRWSGYATGKVARTSAKSRSIGGVRATALRCWS
jgi:hypothetical protein